MPTSNAPKAQSAFLVDALAGLAIVAVLLLSANPLARAAGTLAEPAQTDADAALIAALAADSVAGNALAAYRSMLAEIRDAGRLSPEREAELAAALESTDRQQQQFATILLARSRLETAVPEPARPVSTPIAAATLDAVWSASLIDRVVGALRDDDQRGLGVASISNATEAAALVRTLRRRAGALPANLVAALTAALGSEDRQQRHLAAWLLAEELVSAGAEPPLRLLEILVEGLTDDDIHGAAVLDNARTFFRLAYELGDPRLEPFAAAAAAGDDAQARLPARVLLGRLRAGTPQPELADDLLGSMADDEDWSNQFAALWALHELGPASIRALAPRIGELDWQQSALLTLLAARHGIELTPPAAQVNAWHDSALGPRASRIALAAIYVVGPEAGREGGADATLVGADATLVAVPSVVARMRELSPGLGTPADRVRWAAGWFWFLDFDAGPLFGWRLAALPV